MSFGDIRTAAVTRLGTILSGYKEIKNPFDYEDNEERTLKKGYGVKFGEGLGVDGATRKVTLNSTLTVGLTKALSVRVADENAPEVGALYTDVDTVIASFFNDTYLGVPSKMRGIKRCSVSLPQFISGNQFVLIEINFIVDHVININYS